jgi:hypothetical protein
MENTLRKTNEEYICIVGDSFAGNRAESMPGMQSLDWSWVNLIEANNSGKLIGKSFPGQSFWHQRRWFMQNMSNWSHAPDTVLIFVHTEHWRLPHIKDIPITGRIIVADINNPKDNELFKADPSGSLFDLARTFYCSGMFDPEFYGFSFISWLKEINEITANYKRVIHFFGFETGLSALPNKHNNFCLENLARGNSTPVTNTLVSMTRAERGSVTAFGGPDNGPDVQNHLNKHNNLEFARFVQHLMSDKSTAGTAVRMPIERFNLKDKSLIEYIKLRKHEH